MTPRWNEPVDERLVRVVVYLRAATVDMCSEIAQERGMTRAQVLREALTHGVAQQYAWWQRAELRRRRAEFDAAQDAERRAFERRCNELTDVHSQERATTHPPRSRDTRS